jgi:UDP-glucose 4-epimerase
MSQVSKKILVTGGAGYIGSHTVVELINSGYEPIILDDFRNSSENVLPALEKITQHKMTSFSFACQDEEKLDALFKEHEIHGVIHFAADKAVGESVANPIKYYQNNIGSLLSVLKIMQKNKVNNLVFSSSCTVYGNPKSNSNSSVVTEDSQLQSAESPYGNTKKICEDIIQDTLTSFPALKVCILRYFNPIGAHESGLIGEAPQGVPNNLLPYLTQTVFGLREKLTVFGNDYPTSDGTCIRDYIHVTDLADAHVKALQFMENNKDQKIVFNVGTGKGTSVLELISIFEKNFSEKLNWEFGQRRAGDVPEIYADTTKINTLLNWHAKFTVEDAVIHAMKWEKNRLQHA